MSTTLSHARNLIEAERLDEATVKLQKFLQTHPRSAAARSLLAIVRIKQRAHGAALALLKEAISIDAGVAEYHHNIGAVYRVLGDFERAEQHYATAVDRKPDYAEAYFNLSAVKRFAEDNPYLLTIRALLDRPGLSDDDKCFLHFAAGKMCDDARQYDDAFSHYQRGNAARQARFDKNEFLQTVRHVISIFTADLLQHREGRGNPSPLPVFVVGMPRSGTTLVEQILASHPHVHGAGELPDIPSIASTLPKHAAENKPFPLCVPDIEARVWRGFGDAYLRRVTSLASDAQRIVDKLPQNFMFLGLIQLLLPGARVVHCRRNPLDTCLSCFFQRFRAGQQYSYDLSDLGLYYRTYQKVMGHWHGALSLPVFELDYELLVAEPESTIRRLTEFAGLDWHPSCLEFHRSDRPVTTASNLQVRQPLYRKSVERWRNYARHLGPLREALEAADSEPAACVSVGAK